MDRLIMNSPIGKLEIVGMDSFISEINFLEDNEAEASIEYPFPIFEVAKKELDEYFTGNRKTFTFPIQLDGTSFQMSVWSALRKIPYGEVRSYKDIAVAVNNSKAYRAVGGANNKNRLPIIIPCHRVIGNKGALVGYAGGLDIKNWLIEHETKKNCK